MITPLVKWAGGKRQLLRELELRLPEEWNTYYEPFVGGGALTVHLYNHKRLGPAVIADLNKELVNLYTIVKEDPEGLIHAISDEKFVNDEDSFNALKAEFNSLIESPGNSAERAALLLYLNKHGFNGLWRVNRKGKFNVPFGRYARQTIPTAESIRKFSTLLRKVKILNEDFETVAKKAKKGDFVYFDPPYHPVSRTASFTDYNSTGFRIGDQQRLAGVCKNLTKKKVNFMLSNSNVPEIEELYTDFHTEEVLAKRFINCKGEKRYGASEIIVTNYAY